MYLEKHSDILHHSDWRTLIILDACRFDFFAREIDSYLEGDLRAVDSEAKATRPWYREHWKGEFPGISLLSQTPVPFRKISPIYKNFDQAILLGKEAKEEKGHHGWMDPIQGLKSVQKRKQGNRVLLHLIPPHGPFIGEEGKDFVDRIYGEENIWDYTPAEKWAKENSWEKIEEYYTENLRSVLSAISQERENLGDELVLSSDHSELIGERGIYMHPANQDHPSQTIVPWFEVK